jgi:hypothetical protein
MAKRARIGDADEMFHRFFDRWYDDDARKLKEFGATRPDFMRVSDYVGRPVSDVCPITGSIASQVFDQVETMRKAASGDWPTYLFVREPIDLAWIEKFDTHYDLARVEDLARQSDPANFANDYLVIVCEFGAVLGSVMRELLPRVTWLASWPYWESSIYDSKTGALIPVFHWAIKKFSTYGIDDGFAEKLQACVQMLKDGFPADG